MRYLKLRGLRGVSVRELLRAVYSGTARSLVGITFDDGYENFLQAALPVLERFGFTATVYVLGSMPTENDWKHWYSPRPRMRLLGPEGIREIAARGMEVGSHGMTHIELTSLEPELLEEQVSGSRRVLSELLGESVEGFCYPYGRLDSASVRSVRRAGYSYACAVADQVERGIYDLRRIHIAERDHLLRFAPKLEIFWQFWEAKKTLQKMTGSVPSEPAVDS